MTRRDIILGKLYTSKEFKDAISKMHPEDLRDDLRQEIFVTLCELPDDKLFSLYDSGALRFYAVRIMLNMIQSKTSRFYYKFRKDLYEPYSDHHDKKEDDPECEETFQRKIEAITTKLEEMHWYKKDLFQLYVESGCNAAELSRQTKIPIRSIYHTIKEVREQLKESL